MRANDKGGVSPGGRRLDRRKAVIAAVLAVVLFAAGSANATTVFNIREDLSFMQVQEIFDLSGIGLGQRFSTPQVPGGDVTSIFGNLIATGIESGFIAFPGGSSINFRDKAFYQPFDPITSDPPFPAVGTTFGAYGIEEPTVFGRKVVQYGLRADILGGPRPMSGGTFGTFGFTPGADFILGTAGRIASSSLFGGDTMSAAGFPFGVLGDPAGFFGGQLPGLWDPSDPTAGPMGTLTIPIQSTFAVDIDTPGGPAQLIFVNGGQIIATPAPEPSTLALAGFGVVGLFAYAWRRRKRTG